VSFRGRPRGRSVHSNPNSRAVRTCHCVVPNGEPRFTHERVEIRVRLHRKGFETSLVQVTGSRRVKVGVPSHCVRVCQPPQEFRQFSLLTGPQDKVPVIRHHAVAQQTRRMFLQRFRQDLLKRSIISLFLKQRYSCDRTIQCVKDHSTGSNPTERSRNQSRAELVPFGTRETSSAPQDARKKTRNPRLVVRGRRGMKQL